MVKLCYIYLSEVGLCDIYWIEVDLCNIYWIEVDLSDIYWMSWIHVIYVILRWIFRLEQCAVLTWANIHVRLPTS